MTRETRVGLLLGLVMIVAIGMILSDVTQVGPQDQASPATVRPDYYSQRDVPLEDVAFRPGRPEPIRPTVAIRPPALPAQARQVAMSIVVPVERRPARLASANILRQDITSAAQPQPAATRPVLTGRPVVLERIDSPRPAIAQASPAKLSPAQAQARQKIYTVQPDDSLCKIAAKVYGRADLYKKIYEANRDKVDDPASIRVGQKLVIPLLSAKPSPAPQASARGQVSPRDQRALDELKRDLQGRASASTSQAARQAKRTYYVVRRGDNLTRIARKTLNDTSEAAIGKLFNANRDKLENRDSIFEGMKLRIPNS